MRCWGDNAAGQLGDGTATRHTSAVAVPGLGGATGLALGNTHSCALFADGTARCWGSNSSGELGDGTLLPHATALPVVSFP